MNVHQSDPENFIDDTEAFCQYNSWILSGNKSNIIHLTTTQVSTEQLDGEWKYFVFTDITMFTYIISVKYNVQILNGRKPLEKGFGLVIKKIQTQTLLYHSDNHILCHKTYKKQSKSTEKEQ